MGEFLTVSWLALPQRLPCDSEPDCAKRSSGGAQGRGGGESSVIFQWEDAIRQCFGALRPRSAPPGTRDCLERMEGLRYPDHFHPGDIQSWGTAACRTLPASQLQTVHAKLSSPGTVQYSAHRLSTSSTHRAGGILWMIPAHEVLASYPQTVPGWEQKSSQTRKWTRSLVRSHTRALSFPHPHRLWQVAQWQLLAGTTPKLHIMPENVHFVPFTSPSTTAGWQTLPATLTPGVDWVLLFSCCNGPEPRSPCFWPQRPSSLTFQTALPCPLLSFPT